MLHGHLHSLAEIISGVDADVFRNLCVRMGADRYPGWRSGGGAIPARAKLWPWEQGVDGNGEGWWRRGYVRLRNGAGFVILSG